MSSALRIAVSEEKGSAPVTVLYLTGDLDGKTYQELETKAADLIKGGASNMLLDLSGINFMGSAGLRALHGISNQLKDAGNGQMKLLKPSESVGRIMKTLGFDKHFSIHQDMDSALGKF